MRRLYISAILAAVSSLSLFAQKATWCDNIRVSGFAIAQYQWSNPKDNEANTFNLRMARVALDGRVAGEFYWKTQIRITGNTSTLASSPRLVDLFIEWQKYKAFNLRLGEFQVPFTFESPIHPIDVGFMDNGQAVLKLTGYSDRSGMHSSNGRDIGIMAQGDFLKNANGRNLLHYAVSVVNGQGINLKDVDQRKNVVASFWVMPIEGMRIGVSGWEGSYARKGNWTYVHSTGNAFVKTMTDTNDGSASDCNLSAVGNKADGFYALGIIPVVKNKVNVKARYDLYRNNAEWNSAKTFYEAGADYYFTKNLRLSAEYALVNDRNLNEHNYSLINTELSIKF